MRINQPVTTTEFMFAERDTLVSVTDTKGRQFAPSCTCKQSLLKRVVEDGESGTPRDEQIRSASAR